MTDQQGAKLSVETPVARASPPKQRFLTRRVVLMGGFWSGLFLAAVGVLGSPLDFMWPRKLGAFGLPHVVPAGQVPPPGSDPVRFPLGRFYISHLKEGEEGSPGGILALYQKCPHLGCTVPWRPDFEFGGSKGWFRCPCHGSTYTRGAAILVYGPAPRPMDTMAVQVKENGDLIVNTGVIKKGGTDNPRRATAYRTPAAAGREVQQDSQVSTGKSNGT